MRAGVPPSGGRILKPISPTSRRLKPEHQRSPPNPARLPSGLLGFLLRSPEACLHRLRRNGGFCISRPMPVLGDRIDEMRGEHIGIRLVAQTHRLFHLLNDGLRFSGRQPGGDDALADDDFAHAR